MGRVHMQLGVNSVLFKEFDFATAARHIAKAGYDGVEIAAIKGMCEHLRLDCWREQVGQLREVMGETGIRLLSMEVANSMDEERLGTAFEAASTLGIPIVNVGPGEQEGTAEGLQQCTERLARIAARGEAFGVILCVKAHVGTVIHDTETTQAAMRSIPSEAFGIDMDPSHIFRAGEDPAEVLSQVLPRVRHIHIRDCKGRQRGPGPIEQQACGRGDIDLWGYCAALVTGGYDGPVCLEVIGARPEHTLADVSAVAAESYGYLNAICKRLGIR